MQHIDSTNMVIIKNQLRRLMKKVLMKKNPFDFETEMNLKIEKNE